MSGAAASPVMPLDRWLAALLLPVADDQPAAVVEAGERWRLDAPSLPSAAAVVWGRGPLTARTAASAALAAAARRELSLRRLRRSPPAPLEVRGIHRLSPSATPPSGVTERARRALRGGALVELAAPGAGARLLDAVADAAAVRLSEAAPRPGSGGTALVRGTRADGTRVLLRVAPADRAASLSATATVLRRLAEAEVRHAPHFVGAGDVAGVAWTAETMLSGARPRRIRARLAAAVVAFCAALPRSDGAPAAPAADLRTLARLLPGRAECLRRISAEVEAGLGALPAVLRHGDLWAGNLLQEHGVLSGVVDWDAAHPAGMPGTDLLQLVATERRRRNGLPLGEAWRTRPWRTRQFASLTRPYWAALDVAWDEDLGERLGLAWWAAEAAGTLRRLPHRRTDDRWLTRNLDPVLNAYR